MKINFLYIICSCFSCLLLLPGCDLQKEIEVPLPRYEDKLVVECYLEAGKPFKMTVTESNSYFAKPNVPDVKDAKVDIIYNGQHERLAYKLMIDSQNNKAYNYISESNVPSLVDGVFSLQVEDPKGRKITGETTFLPAVVIKEVEWKYNKDSLAFLLIRFDDDPTANNYYRIQVHRDSLNRNPDVDFSLDDSFATNNEITLGTGYNYRKEDQVYVTVYHIEKKYYDFLQSVENAANANGNPFAQPARVTSSLEGGIGIFTTLVYDRKEFYLD